MLIRRILLWPFSLLYFVITAVRNFLYDRGLFSSTAFSTPIICVGNLKAGGTGKTPHIEFITELLKVTYKAGIVSRGYGRKTRGFIAGEIPDPEILGDEPAQYLKKYKESVRVAVGEDRVNAVNQLLNITPELDVVLLDDAFQHRKIKAGLNILLTEFSDPFYKDIELPAGMLRESKTGARRASAVIVTKCSPDLEANTMSRMESKIRKVAGDKPVFFTYYKLGIPVHIFGKTEIPFSPNILAVAGIANPNQFFNHLETRYNTLEKISLPDHYSYTSGGINRILNRFKNINLQDKCILTTEKDAVKIANLNIPVDSPVFYVPVKVRFIRDEDAFKEMILDFVRK